MAASIRAWSENDVSTSTSVPGLGDDRAGGLDPVEDGHLQVHEHDVGPVLADQRDGLAAVRRDADDLEVVGATRAGRSGPAVRRRGRRPPPRGSSVRHLHPDHRARSPARTRPPGAAVLAHEALEPRADRNASSVATRGLVSKPTPSSTTSSTRRSVLAADGERHPVGVGVAATLRTASCATRHTSATAVVGTCSSAPLTSTSTVDAGRRQRGDQVVDRGGQAGGVQVGRVDLDEQRAQGPHADPQRPPDLLELSATVRLVVACGRQRRERHTTSPRGPGRRRRAGRGRSAAARRRRRARRPRAAARARGRHATARRAAGGRAGWRATTRASRAPRRDRAGTGRGPAAAARAISSTGEVGLEEQRLALGRADRACRPRAGRPRGRARTGSPAGRGRTARRRCRRPR